MNRKNAPAIKDAVEYNPELNAYQLATLNNGVPVYMLNAGSQDVVTLEIVFPAGIVFEEKKRVAITTNRLLFSGTKNRSALQISEAFSYYGGYFNSACSNETARVSISSLSKHLGKLLPVVQDILQNPVFPKEELDIYLTNKKQAFEIDLKKADFVADRLINSYVYGSDHPYGKFTNLEDFDRITRDDVVAFYEHFYVDAGAAIFAAGKLPADFLEILNDNLGNLKLKAINTDFPESPVHPSAEKKFRIINDQSSVQGAIRIAAPFPEAHHPDYIDTTVLNILFGGFFGSRLMRNIREDKGYTYGIYSYIQQYRHHSAWVISTEAGKEVCEATIHEVYSEMEKLRTKKIDEKELQLVKNYYMGKMLSGIDGPFKTMERWRGIILNQFPKDRFNRCIEGIKNATPERLQELANKYLHPDNFYELVVY